MRCFDFFLWNELVQLWFYKCLFCSYKWQWLKNKEKIIEKNFFHKQACLSFWNLNRLLNSINSQRLLGMHRIWLFWPKLRVRYMPNDYFLFLERRYMKNKKCRKTFVTVDIQSFFFSIDMIHLYNLFNSLKSENFFLNLRFE